MRSSIVLDRVQASDPDNQLVVEIDDLARVAVIPVPTGLSAVVKTESFSASSATHKSEFEISNHNRLLATSRDVLRSSVEHLSHSNLVVADLQESIFTTLRLVRTSRQLIEASDRIIARSAQPPTSPPSQ